MSVALVTGCSTGIGFATAVRLAVDGYDVVASMRDPERDGGPLRDAARERGVDLRLRRLDVTDDASVRNVFDDIGDLEVLVNNAGIMWFGSAEETDLRRWQEMFDTNTLGAVRCMQAALPIFRTRGGGCIVNVSSIGGSSAMPAVSAYAASKAALEAASAVVAIEGHQHGIRVVVIQTGATATAISGKVQLPSRESPYWASMRNTMLFLAGLAPHSPAEDIADAVAVAVADPESPFRVTTGRGSAELVHAHSQMTDEEWIRMLGGPSDQFIARYEETTGFDLRG